MKGVEIGLGFAAAGLPGSTVQDPLGYDEGAGYVRASNRAGGVEGGISTGQPIVVRAAMKPIATLANPLASVELGTPRAGGVTLRARRRLRRAGGRHRARGGRRARRWPTPCSTASAARRCRTSPAPSTPFGAHAAEVSGPSGSSGADLSQSAAAAGRR